MAIGDVLQGLSQGFQSFTLGQNLGDIQQRDEVRRLSQSLQETGNINSPEFQQLAALDPARASQIGQLFGGIDKRRQQALFTDAREVRARLEGGDISGASSVLNERLNALQQLQADPSDTIEISNLITSGNIAGAIDLLKTTEIVGVDQGFLTDLRVKTQPKQKGEKGLVFNPNTGTFSLDPIAAARFDALAKKSVVAGGLDFKDRQGLNKDVTAIIKGTVGIKRAAEELVKLKGRGTPAAKLGAVFKFMKALDPTSVVRETEQGQVYSAEGAASQIAGSINSLLGQGKLTEKGFQDLVDTSRTIANANIESTGIEINSLLDTFEDTIPTSFRQKVENRIPSLFSSAGVPASIARPTGGSTTTPTVAPLTPGLAVDVADSELKRLLGL